MNKEKQIEEMAKALTRYEYRLCERLPKDKCLLTSAIHAQVSCDYCKIAEFLVNAGYRKAEDIAREIFAEIEKEIESALESNYRAKKEHYNHSVIPNYDNFNAMCDGKIYAMRGLLDFIAELKKKYTEDK